GEGGYGWAGGTELRPNHPAAPARRPRVITTTTRGLSRETNMARTTPSVNAATAGETAPETAAGPAANRLTALIVEDSTEAGTHAAASVASAAASDAPDRT